MSSKTVYTCDRCGIESGTYMQSCYVVEAIAKTGKMELCQSCIEGLKDFLRKKT